jgi:GTP cyclohydrolase I
MHKRGADLVDVGGESTRPGAERVEAEHLCMGMRGVRKPGSRTTTSAVRGLLRTSASSRAEAIELIKGRIR